MNPYDKCPDCNNLKTSVSLLCKKCSDEKRSSRNKSEKLCTGACKQMLVISAFGTKNGSPKSWCKKCEAEDQKNRSANHNEVQKQGKRDSQKRGRLRLLETNPDKAFFKEITKRTKELGIYEERDFILEYFSKQLICEICESPYSRSKIAKRLVIDHCHATSKFRGLLCIECNFMLGNMKDSPELLRKAADYLEGSLSKKDPKS